MTKFRIGKEKKLPIFTDSSVPVLISFVSVLISLPIRNQNESDWKSKQIGLQLNVTLANYLKMGSGSPYAHQL